MKQSEGTKGQDKKEGNSIYACTSAIKLQQSVGDNSRSETSPQRENSDNDNGICNVIAKL